MVKFVQKTLLALGMSVGLSIANADMAQATYAYVDADAGSYAPLSLGEDLVLNACGSTFAGYSLCDLPSTTKFGIEWFILKYNSQYNYYDWLAQYTYHQGQVDPNLEKTIATGANTVISTPGIYMIGLHVISYYDWIPLPGGGYAYGGDNDWSWSSHLTVSEASVTPPSSVPEPLAALLLLPGFALVARRERRRRRTMATA